MHKTPQAESAKVHLSIATSFLEKRIGAHCTSSLVFLLHGHAAESQEILNSSRQNHSPLSVPDCAPSC